MANLIRVQLYLLLAIFIHISFFTNISKAETRLISLEANNVYTGVKPWSGHFTDYAGREWNVSHFYQNKKTPLYIKPKFLTIHNDRTFTEFSLFFDNGYKSDLFESKERLILDQTTHFKTSQNTFIGFMTSMEFSDGIVERPCYDDFRRQYHCGTGLAWSDSHNYHKKTDNNYSVGISFNLKF